MMAASSQQSAVSSRPRLVVVTGNDTGVGKTVLTALLARLLRAEGVNAVALKPLCSGGREDAIALHAANGGQLTLDEVNRWHFRAALAPVLAARREGKRVRLADVVAQVRAVARRFEMVLVEGAGGLLSPLGEGFDTRDLIVTLRATPVIVVPNRLGAVNQARLVLAALPKPARAQAQIVLVEQRDADASARTNAGLLVEFEPEVSVTRLPWMDGAKLSQAEAKSLKLLAAALRD